MALNIADLFEHAVDAFPDRTAIACGDRAATFAELEGRANQLAHHLAEQGIGRGDHIGLYSRNSIEAIETLLAAYKLRAVTVNVNYRYVENELRYLFDNADLVAVVHERRFSDRMAAVLPDTPGVRHTLVIDDGTDLPSDSTGYEDALADQSTERDFGERSPDDLYILFTGGTTGYPKGVMWRHEDVWRTLGGGIDFYTGEALPDEWAQSQRGRESGGMTRLPCAPLIHGAAQWATLPALFAGDTVVLLPQFDPHEVWQAIDRHQVRVVTIVGDAMARPLLAAYQEGDYDASSVIAFSSHAALFSPSVKEQILEALPNAVITDAIGSSESGFQGMGVILKGSKPGAGGPRVNGGPKTIVIDDDNRQVAPGETGRLARGGHVPIGYYKDPEKTASIFVEVDGERYVVAGDYARLEEDGTITLLGRGNVSINTGGEKVFPEEVEAALKSHADVFDALVVGVPDERLGQRVAALVQPWEGRDVDFVALDTHVREQLAGYKTPRSIWTVEQVGRAPSGKPDYRWAKTYTEEHDPTWKAANVGV
ncbi:acyl-CoA synthetase [Actinophytocola algeriensis]|uniref:Acyl-CoA synthetase (AMP-forming)/AMP-acid ligase II n=1 Tax=Actinophytocola algeriensis TaxID=1768010 RepID=A0A7W7PZL4_9PSEU|nr:acyl-CoA synthetase [Actinophytocola algeriensis]MBB4904118.1 acyl-CoA synthetase (AMP-forming)/AMP-acid ligase II [Actinophytocola algeriensis]MBE1477025.1 acyl-CoA synthetase (AMP-forming)/AMP-acid ligase II [Actinophytocola algeriensis]